MIAVDLRGWRAWAGVTQPVAAERAAVGFRTWCRWEAEGRMPEPRLGAAARALGTDTERLRGEPPGPLERAVGALVDEHGAEAVVREVEHFVNDGKIGL
jgi:hypothetical protein